MRRAAIYEFPVKFWHRCSLPWSRWPYRERYFVDLKAFTVDSLHSICSLSAIFLLPVWFTYWPKKCHVLSPTLQISTKFEVGTIIRCLVIPFLLLIRYMTSWPWSLTFDLGQWSYIAGHLVNSITKFEDPTASVLEIWVLTLVTYGGNTKHDLDNVGYRSR